MSQVKAPVSACSRIRIATDGEGVTTLVTFLGCPLRCSYCLNPNTWDGTGRAKEMTVEELYNQVKIDDLYFITTGGGIVFGGGEPLLQSAFIKEFILEYRKLGWKFSCETSLNVPRQNLEELCELVDLFIVDVKDMNPERYHKYTGGDFECFYQNLAFLIDKIGKDRIKARVPQIPYFHADREWEESRNKLVEMGLDNIEVFPYVDVSKRKPISPKALENAQKQIHHFESK